jgi:RNA polymerase sigma factor (sigma-70 family)
MAKGITPPKDIERIFDKPERDWTPGERDRVKEWLCEDKQLRYLIRFAQRHLGQGATAKDAEDAWGDFYVKSLDAVINSYNPTEEKRRFWNYLLLCFARFCHDEGDKIRKRRRLEVSPPTVEDDKGEPIEWEVADDTPLPDATLLGEELRQVVRECVAKLPPDQRKVVEVYYFEERSVEETARAIGISQENVRVRLHRARKTLKAHLQNYVSEEGK